MLRCSIQDPADCVIAVLRASACKDRALSAYKKEARGPEAQTRPADALRGLAPCFCPRSPLKQTDLLIHSLCLIMHSLLTESTVDLVDPTRRSRHSQLLGQGHVLKFSRAAPFFRGAA